MKYILPLFLLAALTACSEDDSLSLSANFSSINNDLFAKSCATTGCHIGLSPAGGLNLESANSYDNLVGVQSSTGLSYVRVSDSDNSYLIHKLEGRETISGVQMPRGESAISQSNIDVIKQWIDAGAEDN